MPGRAREALVHADALYNLARYLTRNPSDAEDLVQETYERALSAWDRFVPVTNVRAWLFRILHGAFVSRYRRESRPPALASEIEAALRTLSEDAQTIVLLDLEGFTKCEIALIVGCAVGTVESRLSRARAALRLELTDCGVGAPPP